MAYVGTVSRSTIDPATRSGAALRGRAYDHIKQRILSRRYDAGSVISEPEVAEAVGTSRTPVREAFLRLEAEGMLDLVPRRGAVVRGLSTREVVQFLEARLVVERFALRRLLGADGTLAGSLAAMRATQQEMRASLEHIARFEACDRDFHSQAVLATGNQALSELHRKAQDAEARAGLVDLLPSAGLGLALDQHEAILAALEARDERAVDEAIVRHLGSTFAGLHGWAPGA